MEDTHLSETKDFMGSLEFTVLSHYNENAIAVVGMLKFRDGNVPVTSEYLELRD